jgi:hypothetical protein
MPRDATIPIAPSAVIKPITPLRKVLKPTTIIENRALYFARSATFRMASSFPYYVQTFTEPDQRCGLEMPQLSFLPRKACFAPTKVFRLMYPKINYITGFAPAPANVSAFAELGLAYTFVASAICGIIIGMLAFHARRRDPWSISIGVASCIFGYSVSQASLTGSLLDSYGLLWLLSPLAAMAMINWLRKVLIQHTRRSTHRGVPLA